MRVTAALLLFILPAPVGPPPGSFQQEVRLHYITDWVIEPSVTFDALCLLNTLSGDPFYLRHYRDDFQRLASLMTGKEREAMAGLKRRIKQESGNIISVFLCPLLSGLHAEGLSALRTAIDRPDALRETLLPTSPYSEARFRLFESIRDDLKTALAFLERIGFEAIWERSVRPRVRDRIRAVSEELPRFNVVEPVERVLGRRLKSRRITIYLLHYNQPHSIKLTGTRFLTHWDWPFATVVRHAVHELMHPPFDPDLEEALRLGLEILRGDAFLMDRVRDHNPAFGYTTFESFVEEDCVQALEQIVDEELGIAPDPRVRWREADGGMHVLAVALYSLMKTGDFASGGASFSEFLLDVLRRGDLAPGRIRPLVENFFSEGVL